MDKTCGICDKTDASNPPQVKCEVTGKFHLYEDKCDCSNNTINLVPAIKEIENQIKRLTNEFQTNIKPFQDSLVQLRKINTVCERCSGTGKILRSRACAEDDRPDPNDPTDYIRCPLCYGDGKAHYFKSGGELTNGISTNSSY